MPGVATQLMHRTLAMARDRGEVQQAGHELEAEYRIVRTDGKVRTLHTRGTIMRDASGTPLVSVM